MALVFPIRNDIECNAFKRGLGAAPPMPKYISQVLRPRVASHLVVR